MEEIEKYYGRYFEVEKLPEGEHKFMNPLVELLLMRGGDKG